MDHGNATPVTGTYPDEPRLALLTAAEARETIGHLTLLERLDPGGRGQAAGQLAAEVAQSLRSPFAGDRPGGCVHENEVLAQLLWCRAESRCPRPERAGNQQFSGLT
ncbi:hypothetical protein [Streptomyces sp. NPDC002463]|uniref:hypothetical protein n=1 Tax=Streptomyces sp. NPDC002463 TaxID=3364645 RepID=UPI0036D0C865